MIKKYKYILVLVLIIGFHLLLLTKLNFFPYPELFIYSYLTKAGLLPYKQIFDQHFPGLMFFPVNLYSLGIHTPQAAKYLDLLIVALTQLEIFILAKKVLKTPKALLANLVYLIWQPYFEGYVLWVDTFVPVFTLAATIFYINWIEKKKDKNLLWVGIFLGFGLLFKQVLLPLILVLLLLTILYKAKVRELVYLKLGLLVPVLILIIYITRIGAWKDFIYWTYTFNLTVFAQMGRKYPGFIEFTKSVLYFTPPVIAGIYFFFSDLKKEMLVLLLLLTGSFAFIYARFDFVHFQPALPFAAILISMLFSSKYKSIVIFTIIYMTILSLVLLPPFYRIQKGSKIMFFGEFERRLTNSVLKYANSGETIFAEGTTPHIYELTQTLPPGRLFVFQFPWFMKVAEDRILAGIKSDPPKVVIRDENATVSDIKLITYMQKINNYINENYKTAEMVDNTEVMIRK